MAVFGGLLLTNAGRNLVAKAQIGKTLNFKRIALGDGQITTQSMLTMEELINKTLSCQIKSIKLLENNIVKITFYLTNQSLNTGFMWREIGVIAEDPDTKEEVLYVYGNARSNAEYISAKNGADILELDVSVDLIISNVENITASINESLVYATKAEFIELEEKVGNLNEYDDTELRNLINTKSNIPCAKNVTLLSTNWILNETTERYEYTVTEGTISKDDYIRAVVLDDEKKKQLSSQKIDSYNGYYVISSKKQPESDIELQLVIMRTKPDSDVEQEEEV